MTYVLRFTQIALSDIELHKQAGDRKLLEKLKVLFEELRLHPKTGTGRPEKLKHNFSGFYSRRINKKHRLVYQIDDEIVTVFVLSAYAHYNDK